MQYVVMATGKRGRKPVPAPKDGEGVLYIRASAALIARLDEWADQLNEGRVGPKWNRNDVVRAALTRALDERGAKGMEP